MGFYVAAVFVRTFGLFLFVVAIFHLFDVLWLLVSLVWMKPLPHVQKIVNNDLAYDMLTILAAAGVAVIYSARPFSDEHFQWITSAILLFMFWLDVLYHSLDWYFHLDRWRTTHG